MPEFLQYHKVPFWIRQRFVEFVYIFYSSCVFIAFAIILLHNLYVENVYQSILCSYSLAVWQTDIPEECFI